MGASPQLQPLTVSPFLSPVLNAALAAAANPLASLSVEELRGNNALSSLLSRLVRQSQAVFEAAQPLLDILFPSNGPPGATPVFKRRLTDSTNTAVAFATLFANASIGSVTLNVSRLARAQTNLGPALTSSAPTSVTPGNNTFNILSSGKTTPVTVTVSGSDTNQTVITKLTDAINQANVGLLASATNSGSTSQIRIASSSTGTQNGFTLIDVTGNLITKTGAGTIQTQPQDAAFTINGLSQTSPSNEINLDNGNLVLTLMGISSRPATISVKPGEQELLTQTTSLVNAYNDLQELVSENLTFLPQVQNVSTRALIGPELEKNLKPIGITVQGGGTLNLSPGTFLAEVRGNFSQVQKALGGPSGFAEQAGRAARQVIDFPPSLFGLSAGSATQPDTLQILFLLNSSGILQPFILQKGLFVNTFS